jgi:hypothetical protein
MQGRKIKQESRADEFRHRLLAWKQIPEPLRPSLREFARELGTSHQLLEHYLGGLEKWQHKELIGMRAPKWTRFANVRKPSSRRGSPYRLDRWESIV